MTIPINDLLPILSDAIGRAVGALFNADVLSKQTGYVLLVFPLALEGKESEKQPISYSSNVQRGDAIKLLKEFAIRAEFEAEILKRENPFVDRPE